MTNISYLKQSSGKRHVKYLLSFLLSLLFGFSALAQSADKAQTITINLKNANAAVVVSELSNQTKIAFTFDKEALSKIKIANINFNKANLQSVLDFLKGEAGLEFTRLPKTIVVRSAKSPTRSSDDKMTISGTVTDSIGLPIPGVSVKAKLAATGTSTDNEGKYSILVNGVNEMLVFTAVGFSTQELSTDGRQILNLRMQDDQKNLNEVVVLGFGQTQKKVAQTGSIASINTAEIKQSPVANIANALAGRLPGLISIQRSGEPGADAPELYIRGLATLNNNSPLITIDGVKKSSNALSLLDPNEVESITILKDASATALYGIAGANGVIIVKTRRGKEGAAQVNASYQTAIQTPTRLPKYLDAYNFALLKNEAYLNDNPNGSLIPYSDEALEGYRTGSDPYKYPSVNWLDEFLQPAAMNRADFNINGGTKQVKYFVNVGYIEQGGLYKAQQNPQYDPNINYKRYNFRSNTDIEFDENFSIGLSLFGSIEDKNASRTSTNDIFTWLLQTTPNAFPIKYPNGFYGGTRVNPFVLLNESGYTQNFDSSLSGMFSATRKLNFITPGLSLKANYSFDGYFQNDFTRTKSVRTALYKGTGDYQDSNSYTFSESDSPLSAPTSTYTQNRDVWIDFSLNYERQFGQHAVTGLLLANRTQEVIGGQIPFVRQGLVSRLTYAYKSKYFAELNMGYNGSDNFAKGMRYGFFPAVSAGWVLSEEAFLKDSKTLDFLKLRGSFGLTGNDQLGSRRWLFVSEFQNGTGYGFGDPLTAIGGKQEGPMENANVTWETGRKANIGLEMRFLKGLAGLNIDLFREKRNDILIARGTVPGMIGVTPANMAPANMGIVVNKGLEAELIHQHKIGKLTYTLKANGSFARNKIVFMDELSWPYDYQKRTGQSLRQHFGLTAIGFFKNQDDIDNSPRQFGNLIPGDIKYKDMNGDGVIDSNDEGPIGKTTVPEFLYGLSASLNWKGFDISFLLQGAGNFNVNFSHAAAWEFYNGASVMQHHLGRWTPETAATATYPVLHNGLNNNNHRENTTFFMKNAQYLRLKNAELGYTFKNVRLTKSTGLNTLRIYANGMNLYTWDKMGDGSFDPEAPTGRGFFYPQTKAFNIGLSTDF